MGAKSYDLDVNINYKTSTGDSEIDKLQRIVDLRNQLAKKADSVPAGNIKELTDLLKTQEKLIDAQEKQKKVISENIKSNKEEQLLLVQLNNAQDENVKGRIRLQLASSKQNKELKEEVRLNSDFVSQYDKAQIRLTQMIRNYNELAFRGRENGKVAKGLAADIGLLNEKFAKIDAVGGKFFRNVGNYKSGFNGLQNSINQVTRELPAFTNSIQTGFLAISNNLPIVADEIGRVNANIKEMRANGEQVPGLFKQLTSSILSFGTALSIGVTLLTVYGKDLVLWVETLFNSSKRVAEITKEIDADLEKVVERTKELNSENRIAILEYLADTKKIKQGYADRVIAQIKYQDEAMKLLKARREEEKKINEKFDALTKKSIGDQIGIAVGGEAVRLALLAKSIEANKARQEEQIKNNKDYQDQLDALALKYSIEEIKKKKDKSDKLRDLEEDIQNEINKQIRNSFERQRAEANTNAKFRLIDLEKQLNEEVIIWSQYNRLVNEIRNSLSAELIKINQDQLKAQFDKANEITVKATQFEISQINASLERNISKNELEKEQEERAAYEKYLITLQSGEDEKQALELLNVEKLIIQKKYSDAEFEIYKAEADRVNALKNKEIADFTTQMEKESKVLEIALQEEGVSIKNISKETKDQRLKDLDAIIEKRHEEGAEAVAEELERARLVREIRQREVKETFETADKFVAAYKNAIDKRGAEEQRGLDKRIADEEKNLDIQRQRAADGLNNTLELEQEKQAKLEIEKEKAAKKEERRQKILSYYSLLSGYAKTDATDALQNTIRDIAISEGITLAFAEKGGIGSELKDTTTLKRGELTKSHASGDVLTIISPKEGILNETEMSNLGGKKGFYNLREMLNNPIKDDVLFPKVPQYQVSFKEQSNKELVNEIRELKQIIKDKPVSSSNIDNVGDVITKEINAGFIHVRKKVSQKPSFRR